MQQCWNTILKFFSQSNIQKNVDSFLLSQSGTAGSPAFPKPSQKVSKILHYLENSNGFSCAYVGLCAKSKVSYLNTVCVWIFVCVWWSRCSELSLPSFQAVRLNITVIFTSDELHAEVCYAECLLQRAALTFLQVRNKAHQDSLALKSASSVTFML